MREPDERIGTGVGPEDPGARAWKLAATALESAASGTEGLQRHVSPARLRSWSQPGALGGLGEILSVASAGVGRSERSALRILGHLMAWIESVLSPAEPTSGGCAAAIHYYGGRGRPSPDEARLPAPLGDGREQATR
jgi:hypothetical protein